MPICGGEAQNMGFVKLNLGYKN